MVYRVMPSNNNAVCYFLSLGDIKQAGEAWTAMPAEVQLSYKERARAESSVGGGSEEGRLLRKKSTQVGCNGVMVKVFGMCSDGLLFWSCIVPMFRGFDVNSLGANDVFDVFSPKGPECQ